MTPRRCGADGAIGIDEDASARSIWRQGVGDELAEPGSVTPRHTIVSVSSRAAGLAECLTWT